jgi:hypothetical protein
LIKYKKAFHVVGDAALEAKLELAAAYKHQVDFVVIYKYIVAVVSCGFKCAFDDIKKGFVLV